MTVNSRYEVRPNNVHKIKINIINFNDIRN